MPPLPPPTLCPSVAKAGLPVTGVWHRQKGGQTNRLWHLRDHGLVVKLYREANNPLFCNDPDREARCLRLLEPSGIAPHLITVGRCAAGKWLAYGHVAGAPWRSDPAPVARLLRRLHAVSPPDLPHAPDTPEALRALTRAILTRLPDGMARGLAALEPPATPEHPPARRAFLHGDVVPGNIVITADRAVLIDWQCPVTGDPAHDLALFLSPGMQQVYRGTPLTRAERDVFLMAYDCPVTAARLTALRPLHHWLMAAYCTWKAAGGAPDYAQAAALECAALN